MNFGQVLEELKKAEGQANYPRVVLLDSAMDYLSTRSDLRNSSSLNDILGEDDCDGTDFINYLYPLGTRNDDSRKRAIQNHKKHIETGLVTHTSSSKVRQKFNWLAKYHNRFCRESGIYNAGSYMITT